MNSPSTPFEMISMTTSFPTSPDSSSSQSETERPYKCTKPGCFLRFKRKFTLKEHLKTHTGVKPFMCPVKTCGKTFTTSGNLARHKRMHPWLKPLVCLIDGCDRSFSNDLRLEDHMKRHFKGPPVPQVCPVPHCGKKFSTAGNLTRHFKQRHHDTSRSEANGRGDPSRIDVVDTTTRETNAFGHTTLRTYNPQMNEISNVSDQELLATLECLF